VTWPPSLATEFAITVSNGEVWLSIAQALLFGGVCLAFGIWASRTVGLLEPDAPAGETLGVGLASGLIVLAAWWAAIWSGGRSSFTAVAVGFAIAIGVALARRVGRASTAPDALVLGAPSGDDAKPSRWPLRRSLVLSALAGGVFVVAVALLYGSTMAPSPRDGVQPVEFVDEAFYSILGRDVTMTGTETNLSASGFSDVAGVPAQTWYHWGEMWLASAVIMILGTAPLAARHFIVLPLVLLAAATLTGTLVCRMTGTVSRRAYLFGFVACLFLAPMPLLLGPFFSASNVGLIFGITTYGLAAVAVLLALYGVAVLSSRKATWALATYAGSAAALILPAHVLMALLALVGVGSVWAIRILQSVMTRHRLPTVAPTWRRSLIAGSVAIVATVAWGQLTGHGLGTSASPALPYVSPFNAVWRDAVTVTIAGAGAFFAITVAWLLIRKEAPVQADVYLGTMAILVAGAIAWGGRLGDFTMFHVFYGAIAVFATPVAAVAVGTLFERLRATRHRRLAAGLVGLCAIQLLMGVVTSTVRMQVFGPREYEPISVILLAAIRALPPDAKLAYTCKPLEEVGFATPRLLSIDAHTGHRVVPMCFEAELLSTFIGATLSVRVPNLYILSAPQRALYPDAAADPSSAAVTAFLKDHGIGYIYADASHPNSLVDDAVPIAKVGDSEVLKIP
jgi:hypothetical protein